MQKLKVFLVIFTSLFASPAWAYSAREGNVSAILGPYLYKTDFQRSRTGADTTLLGGQSLLVQGDLNTKGSLELGFFHMNKQFVREDAGRFINEEARLIHITMGYRHWLSETFSASLTFFSSYTVGEPRIIHNDFTAIDQFATSARDTTEYGFDISLQTELWAKGDFSLILDSRYSLSVTPKEHENANHYGVLLGVKYLIQDKESIK